MREDKWRQEDNARISLLREVYDSRAQTIATKKHWQKEDVWQIEYDKKLLEEEVERQ